MKKVLLFVLVLIIAVALVGPKIVGSQLEDGIVDTVAAINKNPNYTASVTSLESSWFTTNAEVKLGLKIPDMSELSGRPPADFSVDVILTGYHGPILTSDGFAIGWLHTVAVTKEAAILEGLVLPNNKPFYEFNGVTGLLGTTTYQDEISSISYTSPASGAVVMFSGLLGTGEISSSSLAYSGSAESLSLSEEGVANIDIQGFTMDIESSDSIAEILSQGLYDSNSSISINLMKINDLAQGTEIRVVDSELLVTSSYDDETDIGNLTVSTKLASIDTPSLNLTDINTVIELNNLQGKFMLAYQDFSSNMMENMSDPSAAKSNLDTFMQDHLLAQLQLNPEYNISKLSGKINGSEFDGKILTKLKGVTELPASLEDPAFWIKHASIDSKMLMQKVAAEFVAKQVMSSQLSANPQFMALDEAERTQIINQQVAGMLGGLVQQGMITLENEGYIATFTLEDGAASLNGNPIPL